MHRSDDLFAADVVTNSPAAWNVNGIDKLKGWAAEFVKAVQPRIDLIDEHESIDAAGKGRGFITVNLNWKHVEPFYTLVPTGREGTSVESLILTFEMGKVTRMAG